MKNIIILLALTLTACNNPAVMKINTPAVQAQILGDAEKTLLAGGGALLVSGGNSSAAVAAMTAQEVQNIPQLQKVISNATPATVSSPATTPAPTTASPAPVAKAPVVVTP